MNLRYLREGGTCRKWWEKPACWGKGTASGACVSGPGLGVWARALVFFLSISYEGP